VGTACGNFHDISDVVGKAAGSGSSPEQMESHVKAELVKWAKVAREAKLSPGTIY